MCVGISGVLKDSVFVLMRVDVCLCLCSFVRKNVACQNFRNGDERKQHLHDILTKRRIISLLLVMAQDWFVRCVRMQCQASGLGRRIYKNSTCTIF